MPDQDPLDGSGIALDIIQVEYSTGPEYPVIHIFGRDREKTARHVQVTGFRPYFYVPHYQAGTGSLPVNVTPDEGQTYRSIRGEPLSRLYTVRPGDVRDIRERFTHFEADIPFTTRFMIDTGLTGGVHVPALTASYEEISPSDISSSARVCILDIECEDVRGFPEPGRDARRSPRLTSAAAPGSAFLILNARMYGAFLNRDGMPLSASPAMIPLIITIRA